MHIFDETVFRAYDIRGKYPDQISPAFAHWLGQVSGTLYKKIIVGMDNRPSSAKLKNSFIEGLTASGADVIESGMGPADMHLSAGKYYDGVDLIVMVTASHLGKDMNGFRFTHRKGNGLMPNEWKKVKELFFGEPHATKTEEGTVVDKSLEIKTRYLDDVKKYFSVFFPNTKINARIVVDTGGGTALTAELLRELGADVIEVNNERDPEPTRESLLPLGVLIRDKKCDLAVAHDTDADRVGAVDGNGEWINTDELFCLFVDIMVKQGDNVVSTIDASLAINEIVEKKGGKVHICRVGDSFVSDMVLKTNAVLGGEPSAHYTYLPLSAFSSGAFFALMLAAVAKELPEMRKHIPKRYTARKKFVVGESEKWDKMKEIVAAVKDKYDIITDIDGVKFRLGDEGSVLVRPSNTQPAIRITVETDNNDKSSNILEELKTELKL